jgi:Type IV secretion-system coupling protein DNA-binding domain
MENRNRFSGTLSLINRLNQNIAATKFWAILIGICTKVTWIISIVYFIFLTGKSGWSVDYLAMYSVKFVNWMQGKFQGNGEEFTGWIATKLQPMAFYQGLADNDPQANLEALWMATTTHNIILASEISFCAVGVLAVCAFWIARREFKTQTGDRFKRGSVLLSAKVLSKQLRKFYGAGVIWIGKVLIPAPIENLSFILVGKPQQGKTIVINKFLSTTTKRGDRAVVLCAKPGDFITTHYRPNIDEIFTPGHLLSCSWSISNDVVSMADFDIFAGILCPDKDEKNAIWSKGAREIIIGLMKFWHLSTDKTNAALWNIFSKTAKDWLEMLQQTPDCGNAAGLLANPDSMPSFSFYISVTVAVKPLQALAKTDGDFSIRQWLAEGKGNIYMLSTPRLRTMLNPVFTMFLEVMGTNLLEMGQDRKRRIWWILDELPELGATIKDRLSQMLNVGASFGFGLLCSTQSLSQMEQVFTEPGSKAIINACNTIGVFCIKDDDNADALAKSLGKQEKEQSRSNYAVSANEAKDSTTAMSEEKEVQLVMSDELKMLKPKSLYVQVAGFGCTLTTVEYIEYPALNPAFIPDPRFDISQMELEYIKLQDKKKQFFANSIAIEDKTELVDISPHVEAVIDYSNDTRWQMAQVLTDEDDGICF